MVAELRAWRTSVRRGDGRCERMSRLIGLPRAKCYLDAGRWGLFPIGSRMSAHPFSLNLLLLTIDASRFVYSRPTLNAAYIIPRMALIRSTSITHVVMASHPLPC